MIICLMGPTACGKTDLAIELVRHLPCEIISVDSAMVYRDMNIGTAKPSAEELAVAPHRLIDICDPSEPYSAGQFCEDALREINDIQAHGKIPLLVGGTMLYFHLLQRGFSDLPGADEKVRQKINAEAEEKGWPEMHRILTSIDPHAAKAIHPNDSQRIQRALELYYSTGQTLSALQAAQNLKPLGGTVINLIVAFEDRQQLHHRIEKRFDKMLESKFIQEVENLHQRDDLHKNFPSIRTVGYRQAWAYLSGEYDYDTMRERAIIATRQLAKRQYTWLRRWKNATWFAAEKEGLFDSVYQYLLSEMNKNEA